MDIITKAHKYLAEHPNVSQVFATTDGFLFLRMDHARTHAQSLEDTEVLEFVRANKKEEKTFDTLHGNLQEVKGRIANITDIGILEALILQEEGEANRKSVHKLLANRIEELKKQN
ncbi:hypothetical protein PG303_07030 [Riemerella anatipestifer]|uniref:DUF8129 domain-containing protein n=1 Tax=Riemerella anatipestifer TaxID=34085 RepID=A0AAP6HGF1_RIEAN|nr:hypothetical protein [Riemerella anatipestifer]